MLFLDSVCGRVYEVWIEEVLINDCCCAFDYYPNLDESYADRFLNTVVPIGHLGRSHRLLDIDRHNIYHGLHPIVISFLIGNDHP